MFHVYFLYNLSQIIGAMDWIAFYLSLALCVLYGLCDTCVEKFPEACHRLFTMETNICSQPCMAKICPRTCGLCPLTCFVCDDVALPENCTHTKECESMNMSCIASQTITSDLRKTFQLGCINNEVCKTLYGSVPDRVVPNLRRNVDLLGGCCGSDLCNKYDEPEKVSPPTTHSLGNHGYSSLYSAECQEMYHSACSTLISEHGCNACVRKLCPQSCGLCNLICYDCDSASVPGNCSSRTMCNSATETCIAIESHIYNFKEGYKLGCVNRQSCASLVALNISGTCCNSNFCNGRYTPPTTTSKPLIHVTTHAAHNTHLQHSTSKAPETANLGMPKGCTPSIVKDCPLGFIRRRRTCYYVGRSDVTHDKAQEECKSKCSRLLIIHNEEENKDVTSFLKHVKQLLGYREEGHYWIDAYRNASSFDGKWEWQSLHKVFTDHTFQHWVPVSHAHPNRDGEHCANIGYSESMPHAHGDAAGYYWDHRSCRHKYPAFCEYPLGNLP